MKRQKDSFKTPLIVEVMPSGKRFKLFHQFTYLWRQKGWSVKIVVPVGFVTDFASIPRLFRLLIPKLGRYNKAAVLHDHAYQTQTMSRKQADNLFRDAMIDLGVAKWKYTLMYWGVRLGSWIAWRKR